VRQGIQDAAKGKRSPLALLLRIATARLCALGLHVEARCSTPARSAEMDLYEALAAEGIDDPYHGYNALCRELDSFLEAAGTRLRRRAEAKRPRM